MNTNLINQKELAQALGVSLRTVIRQTVAQKIPNVKIGRLRRYCLDEVIEFLKVPARDKSHL
jgi:excisionase family DNA binding protein